MSQKGSEAGLPSEAVFHRRRVSSKHRHHSKQRRKTRSDATPEHSIHLAEAASNRRIFERRRSGATPPKSLSGQHGSPLPSGGGIHAAIRSTSPHFGSQPSSSFLQPSTFQAGSLSSHNVLSNLLASSASVPSDPEPGSFGGMMADEGMAVTGSPYGSAIASCSSLLARAGCQDDDDDDVDSGVGGVMGLTSTRPAFFSSGLSGTF
eukprot:gnl/Dysnectes_brevis/744_a817_6571.p1 GENE.gnl/Dysnectes_brevis/744_a817_6571~~gnl/Dysnectes_brevis/744_a817_6571.p1  ORF type:complete len:206 (-),score=26.22 gnl/Dysnectes_brevis/744_a817_6571:194-811(-)